MNAGKSFAEPGKAYPTTYVYHHPHIRASHAHAIRAHRAPKPSLQCTSSRLGGAPMAGWVRALAQSYVDYGVANRRNVSYCMLVDLT